jgi:CcmD family protein
MSVYNLLVAAYAVVWLGVMGYVFWLGQRQARLRREIEELKGAMVEHVRGESRRG